MRVSSREIKEIEEIFDVLNRCKVIRIAAFCGEYPYVVPLSFGCDEKTMSVYVHCAKEGLKSNCFAANPHVCIEGDIFYKTEPLGHGITARYESVIAFGNISEVFGEEKIFGLKSICDHYGYENFPVENCRSLEKTAVYKIAVTEITGKRNLSV